MEDEQRRLSVDAVRRDHANQDHDIDSDEEGEEVIPHRTAFHIAADRIASYEEEEVTLVIDDIHVDDANNENDIDNDLVLLECLQALIESNRVESLTSVPSITNVDPIILTFVLDRIMPRMTSLEYFELPNFPETIGAKAEAILQSLRSAGSSSLTISVIYHKEWPLASITEALCDFIMSPSLHEYNLALTCKRGEWMPEVAFVRLCSAVQQASHAPYNLALLSVVVNNMDVAEALPSCPHLRGFATAVLGDCQC